MPVLQTHNTSMLVMMRFKGDRSDTNTCAPYSFATRLGMNDTFNSTHCTTHYSLPCGYALTSSTQHMDHMT